MARRPRFHQPEAIYHVMLRGNDGQSIFLSDADRSKFCLLLQEGTERFGHMIHSFCFMTNHVHLAIQVKATRISEIVQNFAFRYTRYFNRKYDRIGHLFQGRFKSVLVAHEGYLTQLVRYIHLNPVRAGLALRPELYTWSSHRAYLRLAKYTWLTCEHLLNRFGDIDVASSLFENFILQGMGQPPEMDFKIGCKGGIIGDFESAKNVQDSTKMTLRYQIRDLKPKIDLKTLITKTCLRYGVEESALVKPGKHH